MRKVPSRLTGRNEFRPEEVTAGPVGQSGGLISVQLDNTPSDALGVENVGQNATLSFDREEHCRLEK